MSEPLLCTRCKKNVRVMKPWGEEEVDNGLWVAFCGGYASFTDTTIELIKHHPELPVPPKPEITDDKVCLTCAYQERAVLCHECAHELCDWLGIPREEVARWHSHTQVYTDAHPDHFGWDYERRALSPTEENDS